MSDRLSQYIHHLNYAYDGPALLFDLTILKERLQLLRELGDRYNCQFLMPVKAFRHPLIYQITSEVLWGFDISNYNEYAGLPTPLSNKLVSLTDPAFDGYDLQLFLTKQNNFRIYIETLSQAKKLQSQQVDFGIRLNSSSLLTTENCDRSSDSYSRFGISDLTELAKFALSAPDRFVGFHIHHGLHENSLDTILTFARQAIAFADQFQLPLPSIDLGGGLAEIGFSQLEALLIELRRLVRSPTVLIFEAGKLLFEDIGFAYGKVKSLQCDRRGWIMTLDLSKSCHLRWSQPQLIVPDSTSATQVPVSIYGATCNEGDRLGEFLVPFPNVKDSPYQEGDIVVFKNINCYSVSWNTSFNGIKPAEIKFF
jgi:diaminopimelate decarboxylase